MTSPVTRQAAIASLALAVAAPAAAQTPILNSVIVTASRSPQAARDVISDTITIGPEEIASNGAGSVTELLQRQRGIEVSRNGGPGTNASVFMRGANSNQIVVLVDGVRIGSATSGAAAWNAIPLSAIDHIEIVYGPLSTLYGADAIGGVINIFTKQGKGAPALDATLLFGTDATRAASTGMSGRSGDVAFSLNAGSERSDGFSASKPGAFGFNPDEDGYKRKYATGQASWEFSKGQELGALFVHSDLVADYDSGATVRAWSKQKLGNAAVFARNQLTDYWKMTTQAAQSRDKSGSFSATASQIDTRQTTFSWQHDIALGADALQLLAEHRKEEVASSNAALARARSTNSLAASYNMKRGAHLLSAGARNDNSSQYGAKASGSLGYGYRFSQALRASASYGTSFRAPTFNELYYPGYGVPTNRPEKGRNGEIGVSFDDGRTLLAATAYRNRVTDLLVNASPCPMPGFQYGCAYNINKVLLEGVTISARQRVGGLTFGANADLQDPRDESTGKQLGRRSKRHGNLSVEYTAGSVHAGAELQLSGERFDDGANRNRLGGYSLLNLHGRWDFSRDWSAMLRLNNVTDKQYELARFYATGGFSVVGGLRYGFK